MYSIHCTCRNHTSCKINQLDTENANGSGRLKFEISVANHLKSLDVEKNIISPDIPCGRFALSTLWEIIFKDSVFDVNDRQQNSLTSSKSQEVKFDTNQKSCHN